MKAARLLLLLMLAVLLPLRGAVAAAMLCPMAGMGPATLVKGMAPAADDAGCTHEESTSPMSDGCHLCAAFCALTPLLSSPPSLHAPLPVAAQPYPAWAAAEPSFVCSGLERPPRRT